MKKKKKEEEPRRILAWMDTPRSATGFSTVARNVLYELNKTGKYIIDVIGINDVGGYYDIEKYPYRIYPACPLGERDLFGRPRLLKSLLGQDRQLEAPWDILFTLQDTFTIEPIMNQLLDIKKAWHEKGYSFKHIGYFPVDSDLKANWITDAILLSDYPVVYTKYGKKCCETGLLARDTDSLKDVQERVKVIYHGINLKDFHPVKDEVIKDFRRQYFGGKVRDETFLVTRVDRNQPRKDFARTMKVFKEFQKRRPDSYLYLHCKAQDAGGSILEIARQFDLKPQEDFALPANFDENVGAPLEILNLIYAASDCVLSTTLGEGFGLTITEPMRTKTPVLAPNITSVPEIFGTQTIVNQEHMANINPTTHRGIVVKAEVNQTDWFCMGLQDNERIRPLTSVEDAVEKLVWLYDNPDKGKKIAENAFNWISQLSWEVVCRDWKAVFDEAYGQVVKERCKWQALESKKVKK